MKLIQSQVTIISSFMMELLQTTNGDGASASVNKVYADQCVHTDIPMANMR